MTLTLVAAAPEARGRGPSLGVGKGHPGMEIAPTPEPWSSPVPCLDHLLCKKSAAGRRPHEWCQMRPC